MKVPVYESRATIPTQGTGRFLTAQLNPEAMMAPAKMFSQQGGQLAKIGDEIAEFGFKKAEIGAKSEALQASSQLQIKLAERAAVALRHPNPAQAEAAFAVDTRNLISQLSANMSNGLARRAFRAEAMRVQTTARIDFIKKNNARALEVTKVNLAQVVQENQAVVADTGQSDIMRTSAAAYVIGNIQSAEGDLGAEETFRLIGEAYENMVENTLAGLMSKPNADVLAIVTGFRGGTLPDVILQGASDNLSEEQKMTIGSKALRQANAIIKGRKVAREQGELESNAENERLYKLIINVRGDPASQAAALEAHKMLLDANYYTPTQRGAAEARLGLDDATDAGTFPAKSPETDDAMSRLDERETLNILIWEDIQAAKGQITYENYKDILSRFEGDRNLAQDEAVELFRDVYKYTEESDAALLKSPSRMAFRAASRRIKSFVRDNPKSSFSQVMAEADKIVAANAATFLQAARQHRQEQLRIVYSRLANHRDFIPVPTPDNIEDVKLAVAKRLAGLTERDINDPALNAFNRLLLKEVQMQAFE
jgi:hypothetical protein